MSRNSAKTQKENIDSGTGNRTLGSAVLIPQVMRARNVSHYTIPDGVIVDVSSGNAAQDCQAELASARYQELISEVWMTSNDGQLSTTCFKVQSHIFFIER